MYLVLDKKNTVLFESLICREGQKTDKREKKIKKIKKENWLRNAQTHSVHGWNHSSGAKVRAWMGPVLFRTGDVRAIGVEPLSGHRESVKTNTSQRIPTRCLP